MIDRNFSVNETLVGQGQPAEVKFLKDLTGNSLTYPYGCTGTRTPSGRDLTSKGGK